MDQYILNSATLKKAINVIDTNVDPRKVGEEYIRAELHRLFRWHKGRLDTEMERIKGLSTSSFYRILEAFSFTYRLNGVFYRVGHKKFSWVEVILPIDQIVLTGIKPRVDEIIQTERIGRRPLLFAQYLREYFEHHNEGDIDPDLVEFIVDESLEDLESEIILAQEKNGEVRIFDGSHRLLALGQKGVESVRCYVAIETPESEALPMRGAAVFLHLRQLFERTDDAEMRDHIIAVTSQLVKTSTNGVKEVQTYWIDYATEGFVADAGRKILDRLGV